MISQLRSELLKHRSTRSVAGLAASMLALVTLVAALHGLGLASDAAGRRSVQLSEIYGRAQMLGALFAALLGALSITAEFRHGTIRPTVLTTPYRSRVIAGKVAASFLFGGGLGLVAVAVASLVGSVVLSARGLPVRLDPGDFATLHVGSAAAGAMWAVIGVGVGAAVRNQVPAMVGLCAWVLFVEGVLAGDASGLGDAGRYLPAALGNAASGQVPALTPGLAVLLLALYAVAVAAAGSLTTTRRDVA